VISPPGRGEGPNAPVVLLDEPTLGLDPQSALNLREIILDIKKEGRTVLLTTHYMEEADFLSDRIAIMDSGKIIAMDTPEKLKSSINDFKTIKIEITKLDEKLLNELKALNKVKNVVSNYDPDKRSYSLTVHHTDGNTLMQQIIDSISNNNSKILNINVVEPSLEDVFINLTGKSLRE
jgi:ABC-2 type transport system ATP-binding protein